MQLTKNFNLEEFIRSDTAQKYNIDNSLPNEYLSNIQDLANMLQTIRDFWQAPIKINSGFRSAELNNKVGGSKTSQHLVGEAADLSVGSKKENWNLGKLILQLINRRIISVGQLIFEKCNKKDQAGWIHVSLGCKNQILYR